MGFKEISSNSVDWVHLAQNRAHWRALLTEMKLKFL